MANRLKHLQYIIEIIKNNPGIGKKLLLERLQYYGSPTTEIALERDLMALRDRYELQIIFSPEKKGYTLDEDNNPNLRTFENFAKTQVLGGMLSDMLNNGVRVWDVVDIDDQVPIMNLEHIQQLVEAILDKKRVRITYLKFFEKELEVYELEPHLIRQTLKRWYLIAGDASTQPSTIKTFGLERVISIERLKTTYKPHTQDFKAHTRRVYGISSYHKKKEEVVFETTRWQGKYFETLPVHPSQEVAYISQEKCRITLNVVVNTELMQLLASQVQPIKIISPIHLKEEFRGFVAQKLENLD